MDERAAKVTNETEQPENQQNNKDSPEHIIISFGLSFLCFARGAVGALIDFFLTSQIFDGLPANYVNLNKSLAARLEK
jgi:hypothetical protein